MPEVITYGCGFVLGCLVGAAEIISRYRDDPIRALRTFSGALFLGVNGAASVAAYGVLEQSGAWPAGFDSEIGRVLGAGFGAMALFRSAFFTVRAADQDISIGPAGFLNVILSALDRSVDRETALPRAKSVVEIMKDVSFERARLALPTYCFALMQNVPADAQQRLRQEVEALAASPIPERIKSGILGLAIMNVVGDDVLREAVDAIRGELLHPPRAA